MRHKLRRSFYYVSKGLKFENVLNALKDLENESYLGLAGVSAQKPTAIEPI